MFAAYYSVFHVFCLNLNFVVFHSDFCLASFLIFSSVCCQWFHLADRRHQRRLARLRHPFPPQTIAQLVSLTDFFFSFFPPMRSLVQGYSLLSHSFSETWQWSLRRSLVPLLFLANVRTLMASIRTKIRVLTFFKAHVHPNGFARLWVFVLKRFLCQMQCFDWLPLLRRVAWRY